MSEAQPPGGLDPDSLDQLLKQAEPAGGAPSDAAAAPDPTQGIPGAADASADAAAEPSPFAFPAANDPLAGGDGSDGADQISIEELLKQASFEDPSAIAAGPGGGSSSGFSDGGAPPDADAFKLPDFQQVMANAQVSSIDLLRDVELSVKIELGRSRMLVEDVLKLSEGSVVELDKLAGDPVDVFVNDRLVARGEVLVLNDNFCVRMNEIMAGVKEEGL